MRPKISVIIPAYNEAKTIRKLKFEVIKALNSDSWFNSAEIIIVDDGSTDETYQYANGNGSIVLRNEVNSGYGAAVKKGLENAHGDILVTIDGDYQNEPKEIPNLINELINSGADFVNGSKFLSKSTPSVPFLKRVGEIVARIIIRIIYGTNVTYTQSGFKAFKRILYDKVKPIKENKFGFNSELLIKSLNKGFKVREIPVTIKPRPHGKSRIAFFKDGFRILFVLFKNILRR
ncbi:MAG: glycosyltransferase family 2 protein [Candidatus Helarchaeota archaeon]